MNTNLLRAARAKQGMGQANLASIIGKTTDAYSKKERGIGYFNPKDIAKITVALNLTLDEFNAIFFNSELPFSN